MITITLLLSLWAAIAAYRSYPKRHLTLEESRAIRTLHQQGISEIFKKEFKEYENQSFDVNGNYSPHDKRKLPTTYTQ